MNDDKGIYVILTGKHFYIGLSSHLTKRKREHIYRLKNNIHPNKKLQAVYNKGYDIEFEVLEYCDITELDTKEIYWFEKYKLEHPELKPLNLKTCGNRPTFSYEAKCNITISKTKIKYNNKRYNAIDCNTGEFIATGTLLELSKLFNIPVRLLLKRYNSFKGNINTDKYFYIVDEIKYTTLEDVDYMLDTY